MDTDGSSAAPPHTSPWHSPVPYLFGGLAAILGLIAFSLVVLACSYRKLSGYLENRGDDGEGHRDLDAAEGDGDEKAPAAPAMEEKFLVIMAGQEKPTYLATPMSSRASSFGSKSSSNTTSSEENEMGNGEEMGSRELPEFQTH